MIDRAVCLSEAAVVAAVYALFVSTVIYRELKLSQLYDVFVSAAKTSAVAARLFSHIGNRRRSVRLTSARRKAWSIGTASLAPPALSTRLSRPGKSS